MTNIPLRVGFMGTPDFSVPALKALIDSPHEVICVYTQPPRPKGRGHQVQPSPVHQLAENRNIPVHTPKSLKKDESARIEFAAYNLDIAIVSAYGLILPEFVLEAPKYGCLNIHASLLPRWRGASPIQHAIWAGDEKTGIAIMQMDEGLDTGAVIDRKSVTIGLRTTTESLYNELSALGAAMIVDVLDHLKMDGKLESTPQIEDGMTYAPLLKKTDGLVDWTKTAIEIDRQIRALNPWPGVWTTTANNKRLKIKEAEPVSEAYIAPPGTLLDHMGHVSCGQDTALRLIKLQPENAKSMDAISAINGGYIKIDDQFSQV